MKKQIIGVSLVLIVWLFSLSPSAQAQTTKRVQFAKGATRAVVSGYLKKGGIGTFIIAVNEGQRLEAEQISGGGVCLQMSATGPDGSFEQDRGMSTCNPKVVIEKTVVGDYKIDVQYCGMAAEEYHCPNHGNYKLKFVVK